MNFWIQLAQLEFIGTPASIYRDCLSIWSNLEFVITQLESLV